MFGKTKKPVMWVAELGSNHNGRFERGVNLIETAASIGFDAVKFQFFKAEELFAEEAFASGRVSREQWKAREVPLEWIIEWRNVARRLNLEFGVTVFTPESVAQVAPYVTFLKVASYSILYTPLLIALVRPGKPILLSTGMATYAEIMQAVSTLTTVGAIDLVLLHCVSLYPTPRGACNLRAIKTLRTLGVPVGWSDHTADPAVLQRAVHAYQAEVVELHLDLDGAGWEYSLGHCWLPEAAHKLITDINYGLEADGSVVKIPSPSELEERAWRADPADGKRPLSGTRSCLKAGF